MPQLAVQITFLMTLLLISTGGKFQPSLRAEQSEGYRVEIVGPKEVQTNFTWLRVDTISSWHDASTACKRKNTLLPQVDQMRYFYKTLRSDDAVLPSMEGDDDGVEGGSRNGVNFYLANVLEATMDYPNSESGERMCLVVEKRPNSPVTISEIAAVKSCRTPVNLLVCKKELHNSDKSVEAERVEQGGEKCMTTTTEQDWTGPHLQWIVDLKNKAEAGNDHVCFTRPVFYTAITFIILLVLALLLATCFLVNRYWRGVRRLSKSTASLKEDHGVSAKVTASNGGESHSLDDRRQPTLGHCDLLADSSFLQRGGPLGASKASSKQALLDGGLSGDYLAPGVRHNRSAYGQGNAMLNVNKNGLHQLPYL